jgi:hypothetical protein
MIRNLVVAAGLAVILGTSCTEVRVDVGKPTPATVETVAVSSTVPTNVGQPSKPSVVDRPVTTFDTIPEEIDGEVLAEGSSGQTVYQLQETMYGAGFLQMTTDIDGFWGPITSAAFLEFESANGWGSPGVLTPEEVEILLRDMYAPVSKPEQEPVYEHEMEEPFVEEVAYTPPVNEPTVTTAPDYGLCGSPDWFAANPSNTVNTSELVVYYRNAVTTCPSGSHVHHSASMWLRNAGF